jgi:hypothetical protein
MTKSFAGYEIDQAKTAKMAHTLQQIIVITHDVNVDDIPTELRFIWSDDRGGLTLIVTKHP